MKRTRRTAATGPSGSATGDILAIVEAAYAVDAPFTDWAQGILKSMNAVVAGGMYGFACTWRHEGPGVLFQPESMVTLGAPMDLLAVVLDELVKAPPPWLTEYLRPENGPTRCNLTSEVDRSNDLAYRAQLAAQGIPDGLNLTAADLNGFGIVISFAVASGYRLPPPMRLDLRKAATHVLAALRLRRRLGIDVVPTDAPPQPSRAEQEPEAVLSPDGHILHAEGPAKPATARRALQAATRVIERARARKWDQPKALEAWKGLVSARWSLVDRFEEGGRRYVLARENHPRVGGLSSLTDAECSVVAHIAHGCTTKETAYNLGISDATVRVLLMRAARRCSVKTRGALLDLWRSTHRASGH